MDNTNRKWFNLAALMLLAAVLVFLPGLSKAAVPDPQTAPVELSNPEELEAFVDGLAAAYMADSYIPGITVSVVKDGEPFFAKGYGYADLEQQIPVTAEQTLFRPGSISKLFTWTAVMQLVEAGKIDLDADVNTYLDFQIPATYPQPITLRHLLTHTPGFEDRGLGLFARTAEELVPLGDFLANNIPNRVFPPGEISAYSNYGAGLAGYIVERVSGVPFEQYVESNIFSPLGMENSTFRQPLPPELAENMSKGYLSSGGNYREGFFEFIQPAPAGALSSTADDLAIFMIAQLQNGRYGDTRILQEATAQEMHTLQFTHDERLDGWGLGFSVGTANGIQTFGHGGDTVYFHSGMMLLPEQNVGVYLSTNSDGGALANRLFLQAFLDRYYPAPDVSRIDPPVGFEVRAREILGTYLPARMNFSTVEKTMALVQPLTFSIAGDGRLQASGLFGLGATVWVEVEPYVFRSDSVQLPASTTLVFKPSDGAAEGEIKYAYILDQAYIKQPWYGSGNLHFLVLGLSIFTFLAALIAIPTRSLVYRHYRKEIAAPGRLQPVGAVLAHWTAWIFALLSLLFWITFAVMLSDINNVIFGLPPLLETLMYIPWILAGLMILIVIFSILAWVRRYWTLTGRIFYTIFALIAVLHIAFLYYWNFIL